MVKLFWERVFMKAIEIDLVGYAIAGAIAFFDGSRKTQPQRKNTKKQ
jgi:hypothetical protein